MQRTFSLCIYPKVTQLGKGYSHHYGTPTCRAAHAGSSRMETVSSLLHGSWGFCSCLRNEAILSPYWGHKAVHDSPGWALSLRQALELHCSSIVWWHKGLHVLTSMLTTMKTPPLQSDSAAELVPRKQLKHFQCAVSPGLREHAFLTTLRVRNIPLISR